MHLGPADTARGEHTPSVRYINDHRRHGGPDLLANTHISREGDFIVTAAEAGDELLCSYGEGFNPSTRAAQATSGGVPRTGKREPTKKTMAPTQAATVLDTRDVLSRQESMGHANTFYTEWLGRDTTYPEPTMEEIKTWVDKMRHRLAGYRDIGPPLRTSLYMRLVQEGKNPTRTTRGQAHPPTTTEAKEATLKHMLATLGWCRGASTQLTAAGLLGHRLRLAVRSDLDAGRLKAAGTYYDNYKHTSRKKTTLMESSDLTSLIKQTITSEVHRDLGLPSKTGGRVFIHIGAGSAPLLHSAHRHGIVAVNVERDRKAWHSDTNTPTHTLQVGASGTMFTSLAEVFNFEVDAIEGILVSLDCATNCRITAINKVPGTRHRNIKDEPITQRAREEEALTVYVRDETLELVSSSALKGKVVMFAFEHGKATCFRDVFFPTVGSTPKYTTTELRFSEPKLVNWWDYGTPMSKLTHWFTNYYKLWHLAPSAPKLSVAVVVNTAAEGEMRKTLPKVQGLTVQESKAAWPPMFVDSVLSQWTGLHRLRVESAYTRYSGQTPMTQAVGSAADSRRCAALAAQQNRIAAHGYPWRAITTPQGPSYHTARVWGSGGCATDDTAPHDGEENSEYLESVMRDAWIIHDRRHGWVWAHEGYGDLIWDNKHGEFQVLLLPWYEDERPGSNHTRPAPCMLTYSETQLHALKMTKMREVLNTKVLNRGFKEGAAQGSTTGRTFKCTPSKGCMSCKHKRVKLANNSPPTQSSCGTELYRITYTDGYEEDLTAQDVWRTIVWSDAPPGFLLHLRNREQKTRGPSPNDKRTQEQWGDDVEHEHVERCFL